MYTNFNNYRPGKNNKNKQQKQQAQTTNYTHFTYIQCTILVITIMKVITNNKQQTTNKARFLNVKLNREDREMTHEKKRKEKGSINNQKCLECGILYIIDPYAVCCTHSNNNKNNNNAFVFGTYYFIFHFTNIIVK